MFQHIKSALLIRISEPGNSICCVANDKTLTNATHGIEPAVSEARSTLMASGILLCRGNAR